MPLLRNIQDNNAQGRDRVRAHSPCHARYPILAGETNHVHNDEIASTRPRACAAAPRGIKFPISNSRKKTGGIMGKGVASDAWLQIKCLVGFANVV